MTPRGGGARRRVDFGNLGAEELGSVYESLLELIPRYDDEHLAYTLETLAGNERKGPAPTTRRPRWSNASWTPRSTPFWTKRAPTGLLRRVSALLGITVCDPACGSGHFLVAAARRIAKHIAAEETGESEPPDPVVRAVLRRVVGRCIYGVDINPMAAELAKVSLWMEALEPGKPLSYLDRASVSATPSSALPRPASQRSARRGVRPDRRRRPQGCLGPQKAERRGTPGPA